MGAPRLVRGEPRRVEVALARQGERIVADLSVRSAFDAPFRRRVAGGLESRVEIETRLLDSGGTLVGRGRRSCKLLYSLWDERVYVSVEDDGRPGPLVRTYGEIEPALSDCGRVRGLPVALAGALTLSTGYRLEARVVLNPVSEELVERSRQFITNPRGGARGRPNAVLGAVAGLFSQEGGALGDTVDFVSWPLARPQPLADGPATNQTAARSKSSTQSAPQTEKRDSP